MRLELIRENKLKITIGKDELSDYGVTAEMIGGNSENAKAMFFSVLKKAESEVGFVYANSKLVVEAMPTQSDLVIFVTKVDNDAERRLYDRISSRQKEIPRKRENVVDAQQEKTTCMAELSSLDDLVEMCCAMPTYFGGTLYSGSNNNYYILVESVMERFVAEYGRVLDDGAQAIVEEHASPVIYRRAFDIIRNSFSK